MEWGENPRDRVTVMRYGILPKPISQTHGERNQRYFLERVAAFFMEKCAYPEPCVKPDVRMNSLSAYGIDVGKLSKLAGLEYSFRSDMVYYTALVLIIRKPAQVSLDN